MPSTLSSIRDATGPFDGAGWTSELIVCDNNSTDRTPEIAAAAGAIVVFEPVRQIARARNAGARRATGDWLVLVDADSHPSAALFADAVGQIQSGRTIAGGATVTIENAKAFVRLFVGWWNLTSRIQRWAAGSFIFFDAAVFHRGGRFNEEICIGIRW